MFVHAGVRSKIEQTLLAKGLRLASVEDADLYLLYDFGTVEKTADGPPRPILWEPGRGPVGVELFRLQGPEHSRRVSDLAWVHFFKIRVVNADAIRSNAPLHVVWGCWAQLNKEAIQDPVDPRRLLDAFVVAALERFPDDTGGLVDHEVRSSRLVKTEN